MIAGIILHSLAKKYTLVKALLILQLLVLLLLPEILLLFYLAQLYGKLLIMAIICATSLGGLYLATNAILHITKKIRLNIHNGILKKQEYGELYALLLCGFLLMLPGFITTVIGLVLFTPPIRSFLVKMLTKRLADNITQAYCYAKLNIPTQ